MPAPSASSAFTVAREILAPDLDLPSDAVLVKLKARGVKGDDHALRLAVNSVRKKLRKKANSPATKPVRVAARKTPAPAKPKAAPAAARPAATVAPAPAASSGVADVLSNVGLVHAAVAACGGVDPARQLVDAIRACGGPDVFAQYLDLVAGIRAG